MASVLLVPLMLSAACTSGEPVEIPTPLASVPSAAPTESGGSASEAPPPDDLASGRARHVIRSGGLVTTVAYETSKPGDPWTADGEKPLRVEVKVDRPGTKVYLTRATLRFGVDDGSGSQPGPDPIVDPATNVNPGYLVAPPYSYVQSFALPTVDPSTRRMTIAVKLEMVSLVDGKAKDYTKQTITDTLTTAIG